MHTGAPSDFVTQSFLNVPVSAVTLAAVMVWANMFPIPLPALPSQAVICERMLPKKPEIPPADLGEQGRA